ncbi:hypothetical protein EFER_0310 [Escherichia fergusonii ATCC 35469]|nr:hypothetical protein EFER_0310 [Escherichia fergusonii ATCC 35469]
MQGPMPDQMRDGLSPLARGTLAAAVLPASAARFIPAGAGNSQIKVHRQF